MCMYGLHFAFGNKHKIQSYMYRAMHVHENNDHDGKQKEKSNYTTDWESHSISRK